jgi:molecular chaperone Hsp33
MAPGSIPSRWIKCVSTPGSIRGVAIQATDLVRSMAQLHHQEGLAARGLGEAVIAGLLLASHCKPGERINLNIQGSGSFKHALVDADPEGWVRGYLVETPDAQERFAREAEFGPWGGGLLSVLRTKGKEGKQPYVGTVPLVTGFLAKDLSFYWLQSEQIPTAVGITVKVEDKQVVAAGGFMIQALPGASPAEVRAIEHHIQDLNPLAEQLSRQADPMALLSQIFQSTAFVLLEERPIVFKCDCSVERVERALVLAGTRELEAMLAEDSKATVRCDFCEKEYEVTREDLARLISRSDKPEKPGAKRRSETKGKKQR